MDAYSIYRLHFVTQPRKSRLRTITGSQSRVSRSGLGLGTYPLFYKPGNAQPYLLIYHPALGMDMPLKPLANLQPKAALEVSGGAVDFYQDAKVDYRELHEYLSFYLACSIMHHLF